MGKREASPKKSLKKVQKTAASPTSFANSKVAQKGVQEPLMCLVVPSADRAAIFSEVAIQRGRCKRRCGGLFGH